MCVQTIRRFLATLPAQSDQTFSLQASLAEQRELRSPFVDQSVDQGESMNFKLSCGLRIAFLPVFLALMVVSAFAEPPGKALLVVAHPDDEYYFAATVYRMAVQLGGTVDELIITDGEGGFRYSTLAEPYYKKSLTVEAIGRKDLPSIRKKEAINAGRILGIRKHFFLDQKDEHFTTDEEDGPDHYWNSAFITSRIANLVKREHYKYVLTVLPRSTTHGHHQAATVLTAESIQTLPKDLRPAQLGFDTDASDFVPPPVVAKIQRWAPAYAFAFDRNTAFGFQNALTYQIVVNWMIAEHKSQGLLQTMDNKDSKEYIWLDLGSASATQTDANSLFNILRTDLVHDGQPQ